MQLRKLFETSIDVNNPASINFWDIPAEDVRIKSPYDWFIANHFTYSKNTRVYNCYREWEKTHEFPLEFIHEMLSIIKTKNRAGVIYKAFASFDNIRDWLNEIIKDFKRISVRDGKLFVEGDLYIDYEKDLDREPNILEVTGVLFISNAQLESVPEWLPRKCDTLNFSGIVKSFHGVDKIINECKEIYATNSFKETLPTHILGFLLIKGLTMMFGFNGPVPKIIAKYLPEGDMIDCQNELMDAGFEEQAKL